MSATPEPNIQVPVDTVGSWIVDSGKAAGVKVDDKDGTEMSAFGHDLRGAFGACWGEDGPAPHSERCWCGIPTLRPRCASG